MQIPWLLPLESVQWQSMKGKQVYLRSGSPPTAQTVIDGNMKADLRIIREPLFSTNRYPLAGTTQLDFFQTPQNQTTSTGLLQSAVTTNMVAAGQIGDPEVFDFAGLSVVYEFGMPSEEIADYINNSVLNFQFSSSQPVFSIPLHQIPASTGLQGTGGFLDAANTEVGAPFASNAYDVTVNGFPRRIWSLETFKISIVTLTGVIFSAARNIQVLMQGVRYIR